MPQKVTRSMDLVRKEFYQPFFASLRFTSVVDYCGRIIEWQGFRIAVRWRQSLWANCQWDTNTLELIFSQNKHLTITFRIIKNIGQFWLPYSFWKPGGREARLPRGGLALIGPNKPPTKFWNCISRVCYSLKWWKLQGRSTTPEEGLFRQALEKLLPVSEWTVFWSGGGVCEFSDKRETSTNLEPTLLLHLIQYYRRISLSTFPMKSTTFCSRSSPGSIFWSGHSE